MGFFTTAALIAATVGAGVSQALKTPNKAADLPQMPTVQDATSQAKDAIKERRIAASRSRSIYTSPLGIAGEAQTVRKTLLGQ